MPSSEALFLALLVGEVLLPEVANEVAVADLGAVRRPASRWPRLVLGVGMAFSFVSADGDLRASTERGLMDWPPRLEARPEEDMLKEFEGANVC